jgi:DNA-binding beta-propeller fold protein YncE
MRSSRCWLAVIAVAALPSVAYAGDWVSAGTPIRTVVLGRSAAHFVDDASWGVRASVKLPEGLMQTWWKTADGRYLAAVIQEGLLRHKGPARLVVLDAVDARLVATTNLDFGTSSALASEDGGSGFVLFNGKKGESPPSLLRIATATGAVAARRTFTTTLPTTLVLAAGEQRLVAVWAGEAGNAAAKRRPGRVELLDAATLETVATLDLPGPAGGVFWTPDRGLVYALDPGIDSKAAPQALPAHVYVIDAPSGALVADLEVGVGPGPLSWDPQREHFYLLTRPRKTPGAGASLQVVKGAEITHELTLPRPPLGVVPAPDRSRFYVLEERGISVVDGALEQVLETVPLPKQPAAMLFAEPPTRAYVLHGEAAKVSAVDLESRKVLAEITTGRTGKKVALFAAAVGAGVLGGMQSTMLFGNPYVMPQVVTIPNPQVVGFVAPDGKSAYLYNSQTNDYTVVDTATNRVVEQFGGAGARLLPDGHTLVAFQAATVQLFDTGKMKLEPEIETAMNGLTICPDGNHVYNGVGLNKGMQRLDLETRKMDPMLPGVAGNVIFLYPKTPAEKPAALEAAEPAPAAESPSSPAGASGPTAGTPAEPSEPTAAAAGDEPVPAAEEPPASPPPPGR